MVVNAWDVNERIQVLIRLRWVVDAAALTDSDTPLESQVAEEEPTNAG